MKQDPAVALFLALGMIILAARLAGTAARRLRQPRVLGELIVGVILGPTLIDLLHSSALGLAQAHLQETIHELAELGVLLLMFNIGLEIRMEELRKVGLVASLAGVAGALLPVAMAFPVALMFGSSWQAGLFAGVTLAATSVSISAQVLFELGVLRTKIGSALLATALIDDVVAILLVSLATALTESTGVVDAGALIAIILRMLAFMGVAFGIAWFLLPRLMSWIHTIPDLSHAFGLSAFALILALLFGWSAQQLGGLASITGAFIAGVGLSRTRDNIKREIETTVANLAYPFLVPIFFVSVGLQIDLRTFPLSGVPLALSLLAVAIISKIAGCGWGALRGGFSRQDSLRLGVCMISRGEVGLIIATLGVSSGALKPEDVLFPALFLVILLTTLLTPLLVRRIFHAQMARVPERS